MIQYDMFRSAHPASPLNTAVIWAAFQQALAVLISCLLLDGGAFLDVCMLAFIAFWIGVLVIVLRRGATPTKLDLSFIRAGRIPILALTALYAVWRSNGY